VRRTFSWPVIARSYRELIDEKIFSTERPSHVEKSVTVADVFRRYATTTTGANDLLRLVGSNGTDTAERVSRLVNDEIHREAALRTIDVLRRIGSVTLADLKHEDARCGAEVAAWLVKKGICALECPTRGAAEGMGREASRAKTG
jgi:hypothetical protein